MNYTEKKFSEPVKSTGKALYLLTHSFIFIYVYFLIPTAEQHCRPN